MRALLDINVLLALLDRDHIQHEQGRRWFEQEVRHGWASCAITQNGCIRILSQSSYPSPVSPGRAMQLLSSATSAACHEFWRSEISILDETIFDHARIHGPRQLTDVYLLGLAAHRRGRLVTFDQTIALSAVRVASPRNLVVL
jgi:toxin-antitoxin system PIN domain toxin